MTSDHRRRRPDIEVEVQPLGQTRHLPQDVIEQQRQHAAERKGEQRAGADEQRRLPQEHGRDAPPADPERAQRRNLAEPLVDRDGQQRRHQEKRERHRQRREHERDLSEVRKAVAIELRDDVFVRVHAKIRTKPGDRACGGRAAARLGARRHEDQVGLAVTRFRDDRLERVHRRRHGVFVDAGEAEVDQTHDAARDRRQRRRDAGRCSRDVERRSGFERKGGRKVAADDDGAVPAFAWKARTITLA